MNVVLYSNINFITFPGLRQGHVIVDQEVIEDLIQHHRVGDQEVMKEDLVRTPLDTAHADVQADLDLVDHTAHIADQEADHRCLTARDMSETE